MFDIRDLIINPYFIGDNFKDSLFEEANQNRELACSWKIMSSIMYFSALTSMSWRWRAVGIPLNLLDRSLQGDIDLLFAVNLPPASKDGKIIFPPPIYRCFELKTSKINKNGEVKSLKVGKFRKVKGQLEKLCRLGSQQTYLLEAFIVEAGYSKSSKAQMPEEVVKTIKSKLKEISEADYGYATMSIEQLRGYDNNKTGILWPTTAIKEAPIKEINGPIFEIIRKINEYAEINDAKKPSIIITYCYKCKELTHTSQGGPYACKKCNTSFI